MVASSATRRSIAGDKRVPVPDVLPPAMTVISQASPAAGREMSSVRMSASLPPSKGAA